MTNTDFFIKKNDTSPAIEQQLQDENGDAVNISGFNKIRFLASHIGDDTPKVDDDDTGNVSVIDASTGKVRYNWKPSDTDRSGTMRAEWEVTYSDGSKETFPNTGYTIIKILGDIA